jgi:cell pole-organizing protein PopZ
VAEEEPAEDDDVFELTDVAEDDTDNDDPLAGIDLNHPDDDLDVNDAQDDEAEDDGLSDILGEHDMNGEPETMSEPVDHFTTIEDEEVSEDALVDKVAETATVSAFARLSENIALARSKDGVTLEDIVAEQLKPLLKDWLDDNLPSLIERLVEKELQRLADKASRK